MLTQEEIEELRSTFDWVGADSGPNLFISLGADGLYHIKDWSSGTICKTPNWDLVQTLIHLEAEGKGTVRKILRLQNPAQIKKEQLAHLGLNAPPTQAGASSSRTRPTLDFDLSEIDL